MDLARKPKNAASKRALKAREPKVVENVKTALFIRGAHSSAVVNSLMSDLSQLKKPDAVIFNKKNDIRPFQDHSSIDFFALKNDSSLFMFGSHSKKRPNNIVFGRTFDYQVMDMIEFGFENYKSTTSFKGNKPAVGSKPCFLFLGEEFEHNEAFQKLSNLFLDFFRGRQVDNIALAGLDHVIVLTASEGRVYFRHYCVSLKKSGTKLPKVVLEEAGPSFDLVIRRTRFAPPDLMKLATRTPREVNPKKKKNLSTNVMGDTLGAIHMEGQDINKLQTRKMKGLKRKKGEKDADNADVNNEVNEASADNSADTEASSTPQAAVADQDVTSMTKKLKISEVVSAV